MVQGPEAQTTPRGPLSGYRVLEFSHIVAIPYCGMHLADLGADVVKAEPPTGDALRLLGGFAPGESKFFQSLNRGKRGVVIDLQQEAGRELLYRIIPQFDVFMINGRPGVPKRLGADYDTLRRYRPDLIYLENTAFGQEGPSALRAGSDVVAQAYSGLMAGEGKVNEVGAPMSISSTAIADRTSGLAGAMGVCAALLHRERTGEGQYIHTSLLASALSVQDGLVSRIPVADVMVRDPLVERLQAIRAQGQGYSELTKARGDITAAIGASAFSIYYGGYEVQDGAIILGALTPLNRESIRRALGITDDDSDSPDYNALNPANAEKVEALRERVRAIMRTRTMQEWLDVLDAEGAPASRVNFPEEMSDDPQVGANQLMVELEHETIGPERMVGPILTMSVSPLVARRASPPLGAHTDEVLRELGVDDDELERLRAAGAIRQP